MRSDADAFGQGAHPAEEQPSGPTGAAAPARSLPWFRFYTEFAGDPNIQSLSYEDQRHVVILFCLKGSGAIDRVYPSPERKAQVLARGFGLTVEQCASLEKRLLEAGIISSDWQPEGWDARQYQSDHSTQRVRHFRAKRHETVSETDQSRADQSRAEQSRSAKSRSESEKRAASRPSRAPQQVHFHAPGDAALAGNAGSLVALPVVDGSEAILTQECAEELIRLHPGVDVAAQMRAMRSWLIANPDKRKTRAGVLRFVARWLGREQNQPHGNGGPPKRPGQGADDEYLEQFTRMRGGQG